MESKYTKQAAKAAGMISLMFLISRILGFARESLTGSLFNRFDTDSFFAAFVIPDVMYYLLVRGALSAAFIPVFTEYLAKGKEEEGWKMTSTFINIVGLILISFTLLGVFFTKWLIPLEAPHFPADKLGLLISLTKIMFPAVCFTALAGLIGGILNSYRNFLGPALGPNIYNIGIILGAALLGARFGIKGMAFGVVIGAIGNFLTQLSFLSKCGARYYQFGYIDLKNPGFRKMLSLWLPALAGLSAEQLNIWVTTVMASALPEGGITAIRFATRLVQLPIGIIAGGISVAFFPLLSSLVSEQKIDEYKNTLALTLRSIFFIMLPAATFLIILRYPIVKLIFERQKFTPSDTALTTYALLFYGMAIFSHAAVMILPKAFYALQDIRTPVIVSAIAVFVSILFNWIFLEYTKLGVGGFAISFSLMGLINMSLLMLILRRKLGGIGGRKIWNSFLKSGLASLVMGIGIVLFIKLTTPFSSHLNGHLEAAFQIIIGVIFGGILFFLTARLLKIEELNPIMNLVKRRLIKSRD